VKKFIFASDVFKKINEAEKIGVEGKKEGTNDCSSKK
jgi:hypothetical protein